MTWTLCPFSETISYPGIISVLEGEKIELPFPSNYMNTSNFAMFSKSVQGYYGDNLTDKAKFIKKKGFTNGYVGVENLGEGNYSVFFLEIGIEIPIIVHKGVYWKTDAFILKSNCLVQIVNTPSFLWISDLKVNSKDEDAEISFKLNDY